MFKFVSILNDIKMGKYVTDLRVTANEKPAPGYSLLKLTDEARQLMKLCEPEVRLPLVPPSEASLRLIEDTLRAYELI